MPQISYGRFTAIGIATALACTPVTAHASKKGWDDASTIVDGALMAAALGIPAVQGDWDGTLQAGGSIAVAFGVTQGLKEAFPEWRPDRSNKKSFPSGHTSASFAAAGSLHNRHGWKVGLPAHAAALFVGIARVKADKHHWYDVMVGAAIGEATGFLITKKKHPNIMVFPWGDTKGGGVSVAMRF